MQAQRVLLVTTIDPFPSWPRIHQLAAASTGGAAYHHAVGRRRQRFSVIQLGLAGHGRVWLPGGRRLGVAPGQALIFRSGCDDLEYGVAAGDPDWRFVYAELSGEAAHAALGDVITRHGHVVAGDAGTITRLIGDLAGRPGLHHAVWDAGASARVAVELLSAVGGGGASPGAALAGRAVAWFTADLAQRRTVAEAAAALGIGREHLTRAMRHALGEAPAAWLRRRRLEAARQLLGAPDASVTAVAARVGYASVAQFVRAFRARYGRTPGAERGALAGM